MPTTDPRQPDYFAPMRVGYSEKEILTPEELSGGWYPLLRRWLDVAVEAGPEVVPEANAIVVATLGPNGPQTRTVLCKGLSEEGVDFYTTRTSRKGRALAADPRASATFLWLALQRQVHLSGTVVEIGEREVEEYWAQRPRGSQLAAWASSQSEPVASREELDAEMEAVAARFPEGEPVPRPPYWGGYRLRPERVEFWQGGQDRFHDRLEWRAAGDTEGADHQGRREAKVTRLQP